MRAHRSLGLSTFPIGFALSLFGSLKYITTESIPLPLAITVRALLLSPFVIVTYHFLKRSWSESLEIAFFQNELRNLSATAVAVEIALCHSDDGAVRELCDRLLETERNSTRPATSHWPQSDPRFVAWETQTSWSAGAHGPHVSKENQMRPAGSSY